MRSRLVSVAAAAVAAVVVLAGCAGEVKVDPSPPSVGGDTGTHAELVKKAQAEGRVVWYTPADEQVVAEISAEFEKLYGIKVEAFRGTSSKAIQRWQSERDANAPVADILELGTYSPIVSNSDDFVDLTTMPLESLKDWPTDGILVDGKAITTGVDAFGIIYNTDLVSESELPKTWPALMEQKIGEIASPNMAGSDFWVGFLDYIDATYGDKVLTAFAMQPKTVFDSIVTATSNVGSGAYPFTVGPPGLITVLKSSGAPVEAFIPDKTVLSARHMAVPSNAPHLSAGLLFMDFLMSTKGQILANGDVTASLLKSAEGAMTVSPNATMVNEARALENRERLLKLAGFLQ